MRPMLLVLALIIFVSACISEPPSQRTQDPIISLALTNSDFKNGCDTIERQPQQHGTTPPEKVTFFGFSKEASDGKFIVNCSSERLLSDTNTYLCMWHSATVDPDKKTVEINFASDAPQPTPQGYLTPQTRLGKCGESATTTTTLPEITTTTTESTTSTARKITFDIFAEPQKISERKYRIATISEYSKYTAKQFFQTIDKIMQKELPNSCLFRVGTERDSVIIGGPYDTGGKSVIWSYAYTNGIKYIDIQTDISSEYVGGKLETSVDIILTEGRPEEIIPKDRCISFSLFFDSSAVADSVRSATNFTESSGYRFRAFKFREKDVWRVAETEIGVELFFDSASGKSVAKPDFVILTEPKKIIEKTYLVAYGKPDLFFTAKQIYPTAEAVAQKELPNSCLTSVSSVFLKGQENPDTWIYYFTDGSKIVQIYTSATNILNLNNLYDNTFATTKEMPGSSTTSKDGCFQISSYIDNDRAMDVMKGSTNFTKIRQVEHSISASKVGWELYSHVNKLSVKVDGKTGAIT